MISDKPKKPKNTNTNKKKPDTTRDVNGATDAGSGTSGGEANSNKSGEKPAANSTEKPKPSASPAANPKKPDGKTVDSKLNKKP